MTYDLAFKPKALKEWEKLDATIKSQFKKKLGERLENPKIERDRFRGFDNVYKTKMRSSEFRLAYAVYDDEIVILVLKIGKRDKIYKQLANARE